MSGSALKPAAELARTNGVRFPNESAEYRRAREQLLAEEIELRRHIERVAELRRALPPGGAVTKNYEFEGEGGKATLADLFGDKQTLVIVEHNTGGFCDPGGGDADDWRFEGYQGLKEAR